MTEQTELTQKIHSILPLIAEKYGKEIEIETEFYFYTETIHDEKCTYQKTYRFYKDDGFYENVSSDTTDVIETPQIRQILLALRDELGKNPELSIKSRFFRPHPPAGTAAYSTYCALDNEIEKYIPLTHVQALDRAWFGLLSKNSQIAPSLFDTDPVKVLTEFLEVLENLNNQ